MYKITFGYGNSRKDFTEASTKNCQNGQNQKRIKMKTNKGSPLLSLLPLCFANSKNGLN